jgi:hypothetical protein
MLMENLLVKDLMTYVVLILPFFFLNKMILIEMNYLNLKLMEIVDVYEYLLKNLNYLYYCLMVLMGFFRIHLN